MAIAKTYLARIEKLPSGPLMKKLNELLRGYIDGKSRYFESYINDQVGEPRDLGTEWLCSVCGKRNRDIKKKYIECDTCGRARGCALSKKLKQLNEQRIDATPHLTNATESELQSLRSLGTHHEKRHAFDSFLSTKSDYEALERSCIKVEIDEVLSSIRHSLDEG